MITVGELMAELAKVDPRDIIDLDGDGACIAIEFAGGTVILVVPEPVGTYDNWA
jgi:hypothetical protein